MKPDEMEYFIVFGSKTSGIPFTNPERVRGGRRSRGIRKQLENEEMQREELQSGKKEGRVDESAALAEEKPDGPV